MSEMKKNRKKCIIGEKPTRWASRKKRFYRRSGYPGDSLIA